MVIICIHLTINGHLGSWMGPNNPSLWRICMLKSVTICLMNSLVMWNALNWCQTGSPNRSCEHGSEISRSITSEELHKPSTHHIGKDTVTWSLSVNLFLIYLETIPWLRLSPASQYGGPLLVPVHQVRILVDQGAL